MIFRPIVLTATVLLLAGSGFLQAHQVTAGSHNHVWRPTTYGQDYRPGHSGNGATGSITIWSPATLNQYGAGNSVQFARPESHSPQSAGQAANQIQSQSDTSQPKASQAGNSRSNVPIIKSLKPSQYGKKQKRDYGK